jgi:hypothetical protein
MLTVLPSVLDTRQSSVCQVPAEIDFPVAVAKQEHDTIGFNYTICGSMIFH